MRHGAFFTTLRQNFSQVNGKKNITKEGKISLGQKPRESDVGSFSITIALFTTNVFLKAKLLIKNFTWRSLNDYEMQSDENDLKNGQQTIGFFYTAMLHHITL
ncbi:hypothetical protein AVEN_83223-1 [Araneus ventricosus]|uniref:Uncharacterized protein n=1 Tax=Araneus ventricosus TaxID=182803 RepID=A0A4Y2Q793_ARAVE|nr:hypothetical protein AVEN_83223-1 [Araneus ventricosus]